MDDEPTLPAIEARTDERGYRHLMLTEDERSAFARQELVERAVALYLDIQTARTQQEIATELGLSVKQLKTLTRSEDFEATYNQYFDTLGHDPRIRAVQADIVDLLSPAMNQLRLLLTSASTSAQVKMRAIEKIIELNGVRPAHPTENNRRELAEFLKGIGVRIENVNINGPQPEPIVLPQGYADELERLQDGAVDGEIVDVVP